MPTSPASATTRDLTDLSPAATDVVGESTCPDKADAVATRARDALAIGYRDNGVRVSACELVRSTIASALEAAPALADPTAPTDLPAGTTDLERLVLARLADLGAIADTDTGRWVMTAAERWAALEDAAGEDWISRGITEIDGQWVRVAFTRELRELARAGSGSANPLRALTYAAEAVTGSERAALALLSVLSDVAADRPGEAAEILSRAQGPLSVAAATTLVRAVLSDPGASSGVSRSASPNV